MSKVTISLEELLSQETPELRAEITARGKELIKAETLRRLRALAKKKQDEVAGKRQDGVSRLEGRNDMLLSSLNSYVRGLGDTLKLVAELPNVGAVDLQLTRAGKVKGATAALAKSVTIRPRKSVPLARLKARRTGTKQPV